MAVVGTAYEAYDSPTGATDAESISITRRFLVRVNSAYDGPMTVLGAPGLPQKGFFYQTNNEFNAYLFCQERSPRKISKTLWEVECEYRPYNRNDKDQQRQNNPTGDPLFDLPRIRLETVKRQIEVIKDIDGALIANSAGEPYIPAASADQSYKRLTIVRNEPITSPIVNTMENYLDTLNKKTFWGKSKWFWKMQDITIESATKTVNLEGGPVYYAYLIVTYVLEGRKPIGEAESGWDYEPLNYGDTYISSGKRLRFRTPDGIPFAWLLNSDGTAASLTSPTPSYEAYVLYFEEDFDPLQLPQSFLDAVDL